MRERSFFHLRGSVSTSNQQNCGRKSRQNPSTQQGKGGSPRPCRAKGLITRRTPFLSFHASPKVPAGRTWNTRNSTSGFKSSRPGSRPPVFRNSKASKPKTFARPEPTVWQMTAERQTLLVPPESAQVSVKAFNQSEQKCCRHAYYGRKFAGTLHAGRKVLKTDAAQLATLRITVRSLDLS